MVALALAGCSGRPGQASAPNTTTCFVPSAVAGGTPTPGTGPELAGPAAVSLTGGAARSGFTLDDGAFSLSAPGRSRPTIGQEEARCRALAAMTFDGYSLAEWAVTGYALGYGKVSIAQSAMDNLQTNSTVYTGGTGGIPHSPVLPPITSYRDRLAWAFVVRAQQGSSCPAEAGTTPPSAVLPTDYGYAVFLLDASSGGGALVYQEGGVNSCGEPGRQAPSVSQPLDQVSVPWRLVSRDGDDYGGQIQALVLPCDGYSRAVNVLYGTSTVQVTVQRPVGYACGTQRWVPLRLLAATVTTKLPTHLVAARTGLYLAGVTLSPSSPGPQPTGTLINVPPSDNGQSLSVRVGDVLSVLPIGEPSPTNVNPVRSTNSAVLEPVSPASLVAEFRALKVGEADLVIDAKNCPSSHLPGACPFLVHVSVGRA